MDLDFCFKRENKQCNKKVWYDTQVSENMSLP